LPTASPAKVFLTRAQFFSFNDESTIASVVGSSPPSGTAVPAAPAQQPPALDDFKPVFGWNECAFHAMIGALPSRLNCSLAMLDMPALQ